MIGGIIQARTGSTRLPKKILKKLRGKPMIEHIINRVNKCATLDSIILATTNKEQDKVIVEIAKKNKIPFFCGDEKNVLKRYIDTAHSFNIKTILRITSDNPLVDPFILDRMVELHIREKSDYTRAKGFPEGSYAWVVNIEILEKIDKEIRENPKENYYREHVIAYCEENLKKFKVSELIAYGPYFAPDLWVTVDTPLDFKKIQRIYRKYYDEKEKIVPFIKVLKDYHNGLLPYLRKSS